MCPIGVGWVRIVFVFGFTDQWPAWCDVFYFRFNVWQIIFQTFEANSRRLDTWTV